MAFAVCPEVGASVDPDDPHTLHVSYPAAFSEEYLRPEVRLEIGPLASWLPSGRHSIRPYAAGAFPQVFENADCSVIATSAERTFWEKATILHQQAHRTSAMPPRYSRHYCDMCMLAGSQVKDSALADLCLLEDVVAFKQRFYPSRWARYEDARPGTFKLVPPAARLDELRRDYRGMEVMLFGEAPAFDFIIETLGRLEEETNQLARP